MVNNFRVLLVDDEADLTDTLAKRMRKRGVDAAVAHSGQEALDSLAQRLVDVVVLDVRMPGLDGIETLRELKRRHPLVEVILLSGHASVEVALEGMELGAFDYLLKPADIDDLLYKAQDACEKKRLREERSKGRRPTKQAGK